MTSLANSSVQEYTMIELRRDKIMVQRKQNLCSVKKKQQIFLITHPITFIK